MSISIYRTIKTTVKLRVVGSEDELVETVVEEDVEVVEETPEAPEAPEADAPAEETAE